MRIKIHGGTVQNGQSSLCYTCRHATVVRGARLRDEIVECAVLGYRHNRVTFPVTSCSCVVAVRPGGYIKKGGSKVPPSPEASVDKQDPPHFLLSTFYFLLTAK